MAVFASPRCHRGADVLSASIYYSHRHDRQRHERRYPVATTFCILRRNNSMKCLRTRRLQFFAIGLILVFAGLTTPASAAPVCAGALLMNPGDTVVMGAGAFGDCTGTAVSSVLLASNSALFTSTTGKYSRTLTTAVYR